MAYKAFVSSTFEDLKEHRQAVIASLRKAGLTVDPMEEWTASTGEPKTFSQDRMKDCHLCILLVGYRRGHVPQGEKRSITQLEYEAAQSSGIDVLVFMLKEEALWLRKFDDRDKDPGIGQFRAELGEHKGVGFFDHEPGSIEIAPAIARWINEKSASSPAACGLQWPQQVVESLSIQLSDDFDVHMRAGEALSADQARARYVQGLIKLRDHPERQSERTRGRKIPTEGPLEDFVAFDAMRLFVIGGGGSGKTTILKHLAAKGSRQSAQDARAPIVVYLRLTSFDRADGGLDLLFDRLSLAAQLTRPELEALWRTGGRPIVFLLDGVNEVAQAYQSSCVQALRTLLQLSPPLHRYVITSRPGGELEVLSRQASEDQHFRLADIVQFGPERVREYLQAQGRSELQSRLSRRLEELASNPFLLWAITRTFASHEQASLKNRGSLFSALIDRYIFGEREQSKPKPRPTQYNYALIKKPVLAKLALQMSDAGVTVASDGPALWKQISESLVAADREREQKRELPLEADTFMPKDYAAASFVRETVDNGVLVRDGDRLRFMHESVQEYFAAVALGTSSVEGLAKRAPSLELARLDARGPNFETLVTWAGLSTPEQVTALVEALAEKHPLLAAQLAVEAALSGETLERLRRAFLSFTRSEHEQRQQLGARGLAIAPSEEPEVLGRLIELLDDSHLSQFAKVALKSSPTTATLSALVSAWMGSSEEVDSGPANLLRDLASDHSGSIVEALLDVWRAGQAQRDRVAELAAFLDTRSKWQKDRRPFIRERLTTLSVEAELSGDLPRSADIDALRQQAAQAVVAPPGFESTTKRIISRTERISALIKRRDQLATAYAEQDDAALEQLVREGTPFERGVARDILVERRSPAAAALVVEAALDEPGQRWLDVLESFPRESVRRSLGAQIKVLDGDRRARAQLLADLLEDTPPRALLQKVFRDFGAGLRACAARAAERLGPEGVDLLIEQLGTETSAQVLEAGVQVLGRSGVPAALDFLLDLLLDPVWQDWPVRNSESWPKVIHHALADARAADRTMARLERALGSTPAGNLDQARQAVREASRWLPATRAVELLRSGMAHQDPTVQKEAQLSLARAGHADVWRNLLRAELEARSEPFSLAENVTIGLAAEAVPSEIWNSMKADSQAVLHPALADANPARRAAALDLTRRLPEAWVTSAWQEDALSTAENLLQSVETEHRLSAVQAIVRWTPAAADRIFEILMNDLDEAVSRRAYELLGDESGRRIEARLDSALRSGDAAMASSLVERVGPLLTYKDLNRVRDTSARWLDAGNRDQCMAALLALTFHPAPEDDNEWKEIGNRARAAFERLEIDETWQRFAAHIRPLGERRRQFVYILLDAFEQKPEQFTVVLTAVGDLWQDDLPTLGYPILIDIDRDPDQAVKRLAAIEDRFPDRVSHLWLANQFARLNRPADALRQYRLAAAQQPTNDDIQFHVGWLAFTTGDFDGSIDATRRSLTLQPANAMAQFNLGVALLARRETVGAEAAYRRGAALARRMSPSDARQQIEGALGDFALLPEVPETVTVAVDRIRASLERERERLAASAEDA